MSDKVTETKERAPEEQTGTCQYCGQSQIVETVGESTQAERDAIATDRCTCSQAQIERRKKERKVKIKAYIRKHFTPERADLVRAAINLVEGNDLDKVSLNYDSKTCTIWLDADAYLHLKVQRRDEDELKV